MMHIPIDDEHPLDAMASLRVPGGQGDIIQDAKAHPAVGAGVMPRGAHRAKGIGNPTSHDRIHCGQGATNGRFRRVPGLRTDRRVAGAELRLVRVNLSFRQAKVISPVDQA